MASIASLRTQQTTILVVEVSKCICCKNSGLGLTNTQLFNLILTDK